MKNIFVGTKEIFESNSSLFDKIDSLAALYEAAKDELDEENPDVEGDDTEETDTSEDDMTDPTMPSEGDDGEPAEADTGIYISSNQKAVIAKAMLNALMITPPQPGEIPQELLNVTDANADDVINFVQSFNNIAGATDTSITSDSNPESLSASLKAV